jgi:hypothetical protein
MPHGDFMSAKLLIATGLTAIMAAMGCHKAQPTATDGIREGIQQHLSSLNTLNLSAMDINITHVSINQNTAQAQAEFVPKTGALPGATMRVSYSLEKRDDRWVVVKTNALGGAIDHPDPSANPHVQAPPGSIHGNMPNFREIIPSTTPDSNSTLPPGHPPVASADKPK